MITHDDLPSPFAQRPNLEIVRAPVTSGVPDEVAAALRARFGKEWPSERSRAQPTVAEQGRALLRATVTHDDLPPPPPPDQVFQQRERPARGSDLKKYWEERFLKQVRELLAEDDPGAAGLALVEAAVGDEPLVSGEIWSRARFLLEVCARIGDRTTPVRSGVLTGLARDPLLGVYFVVAAPGEAPGGITPGEVVRGASWRAEGPWEDPTPAMVAALAEKLLGAREALCAQGTATAIATSATPPKDTAIEFHPQDDIEF